MHLTTKSAIKRVSFLLNVQILELINCPQSLNSALLNAISNYSLLVTRRRLAKRVLR